MVMAAVLALPAGTAVAGGPADAPQAAAITPGPAPAVTVLSYNVKGLPWPVAHHRGLAADEIAAALRAMRTDGDAPQVVAVQEAFGPAQQRIGALAGYPYSVFGPDRALAGPPPATPQQHRFVTHDRFWRGEGMGKFADSGLAVFSSYPVLWVKRLSYGDACAGWDCMANKGALAVALSLPGVAQPLVVVDTHLNAERAAHSGQHRSFAAYRRQLDLLSRFVGGIAPDAGAIVLTGDFNIGHDGTRGASLDNALFAADGLRLAATEKVCGRACRAAADAPGEAGTVVPADALVRTKSLIAYRDVAPGLLAPAGHVVTFGTRPDGHMLSDHVGIAMQFALTPSATRS